MIWRPVVLVLAAGAGSRFGADLHKLSQAFGGSTVLGESLRNVALTPYACVLVITESVLRSLPVGLQRSTAMREIVAVPEPGPGNKGMAHSIGAGVSASAWADAWLVLPGDMPMVQAATMVAIGQSLKQNPIAYAQYLGKRGHPVGFSAEFYSELTSLKGDEGARRLLARFPSHPIDVDDPGVLSDIDTPQDLERLRREVAISSSAS